MGLLSLPQELVDLITNGLSDPCDLLALRLTNRFFDALLAPRFALEFPEKFYFKEYPHFEHTYCTKCPDHSDNGQGCILSKTECLNTFGTPCAAMYDLHMPQYTYDALSCYAAKNNHLRLARRMSRTPLPPFLTISGKIHYLYWRGEKQCWRYYEHTLQWL